MQEKNVNTFNNVTMPNLAVHDPMGNTKAHKFETVESESRLLLSSTRFSSVNDLITGLRNTFDLRFIKKYEFLDIYYRNANNLADNETLRLRIWTLYETENGRQIQPVQVIKSSYTYENLNGIAFKSGPKSSKVLYSTLEEAQTSLAKEGFEEELRILKTDGVHYRISGGEIERRIACETVTAFHSNSSIKWSSMMLEVEVLSDDRDKVARGLAEVLKVLGSNQKDLIGEPMKEIALKQLKNIDVLKGGRRE